MVQFVLEGARLKTLHLERQRRAPRILGLELETGSADHITGKVRYRQTPLAADRKALPVDDLRVDQDQVTLSTDLGSSRAIQDQDTLVPADLGGRDAHRGGARTARLLKIRDEVQQCLVELANGPGDLFQTCVRQPQDG